MTNLRNEQPDPTAILRRTLEQYDKSNVLDDDIDGWQWANEIATAARAVLAPLPVAPRLQSLRDEAVDANTLGQKRAIFHHPNDSVCETLKSCIDDGAAQPIGRLLWRLKLCLEQLELTAGDTPAPDRRAESGLVARIKLLTKQFRSLGGVPELCDLAWELCEENERLKAAAPAPDQRAEDPAVREARWKRVAEMCGQDADRWAQKYYELLVALPVAPPKEPDHRQCINCFEPNQSYWADPGGHVGPFCKRCWELIAALPRVAREEPVTACCAEPIGADRRFCPRCGYEARVIEGDTPPPEPEKEK